MRIAVVATIMALSSTAFAGGYWVTAGGQIVRGAHGECWHTTAWTPAMAVPGCDGVPLVAPTLPAAPPPPPVPLVVVPVPPADSDMDGVVDPEDKCPATPAGVKVDATGCPPDADGDGVADYLDKCPATPGGAVVDAVGCPKKLEHEATIGLDVMFDTDKAEIKGDASSEIQKVVTFMKQYPAVNVTIEGYTDNVGGNIKNKKLSQKRADAVKAALVAGGVDGARLSAVGFGAEKPIADNKTPEGRAQNRRVVAHAKAEVVTIEMKK